MAQAKRKTTTAKSKNAAPQGADYINKQRREYSLYVLQSRAVPHIADGLKAAARRVMWMAKDGQKWKSATLAGACMPIHPHAAPEDTVNTLAAHYGNNVPLLTGIGTFGTRLDPTAYGASRYTSVKVSEFAKDAFYTDIELIPMKPNYDNTTTEPVHFLPLVPLSITNSTSGIAVGFACDIFPRDLKQVIAAQIKHLNGTNITKEPNVSFKPLGSEALGRDDKGKWVFKGEVEQVNTTTVRITNFPAAVNHEKLVDKLIKFINDGKMVDYADDSKDVVDITCKFRRDQLLKLNTEEKLLTFFGLDKAVKENINMIDFNGTTVISPTAIETIKMFTDWRLEWYVKRYERLAKLEQEKIQKYEDVLTAIKNDAGSKAPKKKNREELKDWLGTLGIVYIDYIAGLPVYRFTKAEKKIVEEKLKESKAILREYKALIKSPKKRSEKYIEELKVLSKKYG